MFAFFLFLFCPELSVSGSLCSVCLSPPYSRELPSAGLSTPVAPQAQTNRLYSQTYHQNLVHASENRQVRSMTCTMTLSQQKASPTTLLPGCSDKTYIKNHNSGGLCSPDCFCVAAVAGSLIGSSPSTHKERTTYVT